MSTNAETLWHYMSFAKFMALLDTEALFFNPIRKFVDDHEGFIHAAFYDEFHSLMLPIYDLGEQKTLWTVEHVQIHILNSCYVSCWCISEEERKAMWDAYVGCCPGVAIRTRSDVLVDYLKKQYDGQLLSGPVDYVNENDSPVRLQGPPEAQRYRGVISEKENLPAIIAHMRNYEFVFQKRRQFEYESEFRLLALGDHGIDFDSWEHCARSGIGVEYGTLTAIDRSLYVENEGQIKQIRNTIPSKGVGIRFRLDEVADKIIISPGAPSWFFTLVRKMLSRCGMAGVEMQGSAYTATSTRMCGLVS